MTLARVQGSSPREAGARMVVRPSGGFHGTIGGGALEWVALEAALAALKAGRGPRRGARWRWAPNSRNAAAAESTGGSRFLTARDVEELGALAAAEGEGAGSLTARIGADGRVERRLDRDRPGGRLTEALPDGKEWTEPIGESARAVYLFGAGHVGRALALALAPLPFVVRWIDLRREAFPARAPANVALIHAPEPASELANAPDGALIVVMTHSHAIDLDIVAAALKSERFGYVGLIGSATKRARFLSQMRDAGLTEAMLARLVCPIGVPGIEGKDPAVIAASTAAQLLMMSERLAGEGREGAATRT